MATLLHDTSIRDSIRTRIERLTPDATRRWGKMSVDQMLWHVNQALVQALGEAAFVPQKAPIPGPVLKFMVLSLPWIKGAPTAPELVAVGQRHDFAAERSRCFGLIDAFTARRLDDSWVDSSVIGAMSGRDWSRLQAKHLNHHLTQFSA